MTKVILDRATLAKLHHLTERLELCDEAGHTLAYVSPVTDPSLYDRVQVPTFSDEDLDRFEREPGGRTLAEILADLQKRSS